MQTIKETAANVVASAKSGMEETKASVQDKVMTADSPTEKDVAAETKQERNNNAGINNEKNAAAGQGGDAGGSYSYSTTREVGQSAGSHQMSALPGHGTGEPAGQVVEGTIKSHPIGTATGTGRPTTAHNTHVGAGTNKVHGTGGAYSG